jgi:hypothetical protein
MSKNDPNTPANDQAPKSIPVPRYWFLTLGPLLGFFLGIAGGCFAYRAFAHNINGGYFGLYDIIGDYLMYGAMIGFASGGVIGAVLAGLYGGKTRRRRAKTAQSPNSTNA